MSDAKPLCPTCGAADLAFCSDAFHVSRDSTPFAVAEAERMVSQHNGAMFRPMDNLRFLGTVRALVAANARVAELEEENFALRQIAKPMERQLLLERVAELEFVRVTQERENESLRDALKSLVSRLDEAGEATPVSFFTKNLDAIDELLAKLEGRDGTTP